MRRYKRGLLNFSQYFQSADECSVYFSNENPILLSYKDKAGKIVIIDQELHEMFQETLESILMD